MMYSTATAAFSSFLLIVALSFTGASGFSDDLTDLILRTALDSVNGQGASRDGDMFHPSRRPSSAILLAPTSSAENDRDLVFLVKAPSHPRSRFNLYDPSDFTNDNSDPGYMNEAVFPFSGLSTGPGTPPQSQLQSGERPSLQNPQPLPAEGLSSAHSNDQANQEPGTTGSMPLVNQRSPTPVSVSEAAQGSNDQNNGKNPAVNPPPLFGDLQQGQTNSVSGSQSGNDPSHHQDQDQQDSNDGQDSTVQQSSAPQNLPTGTFNDATPALIPIQIQLPTPSVNFIRALTEQHQPISGINSINPPSITDVSGERPSFPAVSEGPLNYIPGTSPNYSPSQPPFQTQRGTSDQTQFANSNGQNSAPPSQQPLPQNRLTNGPSVQSPVNDGMSNPGSASAVAGSQALPSFAFDAPAPKRSFGNQADQSQIKHGNRYNNYNW